MPERFELGTLPYEVMAGVTAAVDFIAALGTVTGTRRQRLMAASRLIDDQELALRERIEAGLRGFGGRLWEHSRASVRTPTLFFTFPERDASTVSRFLAERDVLVPAGSFYAYEPFRARTCPWTPGCG